MQNGSVESFNSRLRDECLNDHLFANPNEITQIVEAWRIDYWMADGQYAGLYRSEWRQLL
jgi:hypothetical protein